MDNNTVTRFINELMHPNIFTGVVPLLIIAEELPTVDALGSMTEAVWISIDSKDEFRYINKFAVNGKIHLHKYYEASDRDQFFGRVALLSDKNLKKVLLHRKSIEEIKNIQEKRSKLLDTIIWGFDRFLNYYKDEDEIYIFKKKENGWDDWKKDFFSDFDIDNPYKVLGLVDSSMPLKLNLQNTKTGKSKECIIDNTFYGFFVGSMPEIIGLKLKSESYQQTLGSLQEDAKRYMRAIDWLALDSPKVVEINERLPQHPFEEYFRYVKKEDVRKLDVSNYKVDLLKSVILKHMPESNTPFGLEYISLDKLLFLFHQIIPRKDALRALELCDIVYEPPALLLGFEGKRQSSPKFLVPVSHVAYAYEQFKSYRDSCRDFEESLQLIEK